MKCSELTTYVPREFKALAKRFNLEPEYLAFLVLSDLCDHPPEGFVILSDDPDDARRAGEFRKPRAVLRSDWRAFKAKIRDKGTPGVWMATKCDSAL